MAQMAQSFRIATFGLVMLAGGIVGGCGGGVATSSLGLSAAVELPSLSKLPSLPAARGYVAAAPTEAYALVARGATSCWFGAGGPLKISHIFHAEADPPSNGGRVEIALLERDMAAQTPRGPKAYRIGFGGEGNGTRIEYTNHKLPDALAAGIEADVHRFAGGDLTCAAVGATAPRLEPTPASIPKNRPRQKQSARGG